MTSITETQQYDDKVFTVAAALVCNILLALLHLMQNYMYFRHLLKANYLVWLSFGFTYLQDSWDHNNRILSVVQKNVVEMNSLCSALMKMEDNAYSQTLPCWHSSHSAWSTDSTYNTNLTMLAQFTERIKYWLHVWYKPCPAGAVHKAHQILTPCLTQTLTCSCSSLRASSVDSTFDTNLALLAQLTQSIKHWLHVWHKPCPARAAHSEHQASTPRLTQTLPCSCSSLRASSVDSTFDTNLALLAQLTQSIKHRLHVWHKPCPAGAAHSEHQASTPRLTQSLWCCHDRLD